MCQTIGRPPISTIGLGLTSVSSANRVPMPPAKTTTRMDHPRQHAIFVSEPEAYSFRAGLPTCLGEKCDLLFARPTIATAHRTCGYAYRFGFVKIRPV